MRLGILGGSFNPVHAGHVRLAVEVLEGLGLDGVELIPAAVPYHKKAGMLPYEDRLELARLAVEAVDGLWAGDLERGRIAPSYTCDLLADWKREHPGDDPWFILGEDNLFDLPNWKNGLDLPDLAHLAVALRSGERSAPGGGADVRRIADFLAENRPDAQQVDGAGGFPAWRFASGRTLACLDIPRLDICSTDVRAAWRAGRRLSCLVPEAVELALGRSREKLLEAWGAEG